MIKPLCLALLGCISLSAHAENIIRVAAPIKGVGIWESIGWVYSDWVENGGLVACTDWTPLASSFPQGVQFMQSRSCYQPYTRTGQVYEINSLTQATRAVGEPQTMGRNDKKNFNNQGIGTATTLTNCRYSFGPSTYVRQDGEGSTSFTWYLDGRVLSGSEINNYAMGELMTYGPPYVYWSICEKPAA
ncbi:hypothetical protein PLA107_031775 (plasmid) [Pseudomonas amygdali pv. lachrymans str. M301315]|uniref:Uncharacterized protein n=2 Tax=Pseudomonas amygdali pv. lachrymans TaxID=53707 RepID=A0AAD0PW33_PSEAV|nr:hypothetical protein [Pseudomonas amygdali]AXH59805.1 hypothetical protein PLA107_031775 [Pseudomonas amygdali pv. lachrymans str. M301315]